MGLAKVEKLHTRLTHWRGVLTFETKPGVRRREVHKREVVKS